MIPKVIHYCWFGRGKKNKAMKKCIKSWRKFFPDYEIKEWNEDNYDVQKNSYIRDAYNAKKYAFVSDYARFDILYTEGGIYLDTDVEIIKSFDDILINGAFMGCEKDGKDNVIQKDNDNCSIMVNPGLGMAAEPGMQIYKELLDLYNTLEFIQENGNYNLTTIVYYTTMILKEKGMKNINEIQNVAGITIYPKEYFSPKDVDTGMLCITKRTHSIHHYSASWYTPKEKLIKFLGPRNTEIIVKVMHKLKGIK